MSGFYKNIGAEVQAITDLSQTIEIGQLYRISEKFLERVLENMNVDSLDEIPDNNPSKSNILNLVKISDGNTYVMLKEVEVRSDTSVCGQCLFNKVFGLCLMTNCTPEKGESNCYVVKKIK